MIRNIEVVSIDPLEEMVERSLYAYRITPLQAEDFGELTVSEIQELKESTIEWLKRLSKWEREMPALFLPKGEIKARKTWITEALGHTTGAVKLGLVKDPAYIRDLQNATNKYGGKRFNRQKMVSEQDVDTWDDLVNRALAEINQSQTVEEEAMFAA